MNWNFQEILNKDPSSAWGCDTSGNIPPCRVALRRTCRCTEFNRVKNANLRHTSCTVVTQKRKSASPVRSVLIAWTARDLWRQWRKNGAKSRAPSTRSHDDKKRWRHVHTNMCFAGFGGALVGGGCVWKGKLTTPPPKFSIHFKKRPQQVKI